MNDIINQAAKDYDVPYDIVKRIYEDNPDMFYENMEKYIQNRVLI